LDVDGLTGTSGSWAEAMLLVLQKKSSDVLHTDRILGRNNDLTVSILGVNIILIDSLNPWLPLLLVEVKRVVEDGTLSWELNLVAHH
jgi:hypothetical protein